MKRVEDSKLFGIYSFLGDGAEGEVFKIEDELAYKRFYLKYQKRLALKFKKIALLSQMQDPNFAFPLDYCVNEDSIKTGYCMPLIKGTRYQSFDDMAYKNRGEMDIKLYLETIKKISNAVERLHRMGITIGDMRPKNILINEEMEPIFVDTDGYAFDDFDYDLDLSCVYLLKTLYKEKYSYEDIDKYLLGIIAIQPLLEGTVIEGQIIMQKDDSYFQKLISLMNISKEDKLALREIFSKKHDKPYIGPILERINPKGRIFKYADAPKVNK